MARRAAGRGADPWLLGKENPWQSSRAPSASACGSCRRATPTKPRVAKEGGKLPESINGRLATRLALSYNTLANLHQQLGNALQGPKRGN